ncbi:MAG: hypothetical protein IAF02_08220 [Anaerolineae bacterium]|nr:hypothetical protein [Anaerolineae bacterium]
MRKALLLLVVFLLLLVAPTVVRYLQYYQIGGTDRQSPPVYDPAQIAAVPTPASNPFTDAPQKGAGLVLLDNAHDNSFSLNDISYLDGRLAARGFELLHFTEGDLARQLRPVNAFITITPLSEFTAQEIQAITRFVARGGRVLMVGDPTRYNIVFDEEDPFAFTFELDTNQIPLNSLANQFGLIFNGDYLYNTVENEGNFRNIVLKSDGFAEDGLVDGLDELAVYSTHSLQLSPEAKAILTADDNTWSSATDRPGGLVLAAKSENGRVLALGDIHFLTDPYYTVYDNSHFIANIADFLTEADERALTLVDFPYFYQQPVNLVYTGSPDLGAGAFTDIIGLQTAFQQANIPLTLAEAVQPDHDTLYLGLYNQAEDVADILASAGISLTIEPPILPDVAEEEPAAADADAAGRSAAEAEEEVVEPPETEPEIEEIRLIHSDLGNIEMSGSALIVLDEQNGRRDVVVLAASREGLDNTVARLLELIPLDAETALGNCLLQDPIAICPTLVADEAVEAELITSGGDIVEPDESDDDASDDESEPGPEIDAVDMGSISLGETVFDIEIAEEESHAWTFDQGPIFIDVILETSEEMDGVLEIYDPLNHLIASSDTGFTGETETLSGVDIPDDGDYTIVVRGFYGAVGTYTLTVIEGEEETAVIQSIFLFIDDDGEPIGAGLNSLETFMLHLQDNYDLTTWVSSLDGPLSLDMLEAYDLIIWDSGTYLNKEGFFDEDTNTIFQALESGGKLLATGSAPSAFGDMPLSNIADVSVTGDDPILLENLNAGDIYPLDQRYEAIISDAYSDELDPSTLTFLLRGPESDDENTIAAFGVTDTEYNQQTFFMMFPFAALPEEVEPIFLENILNWFGS